MSHPLWTEFQVTWDFVTKLCASVPADPALRQAWLESRQPAVRPPSSRSMTEINEEVVATLAETEPEDELGGLLVFQRVEGQLAQRTATIRAHIKDCARVLSNQYVGKIKGERSWATRVVNGVYLKPFGLSVMGTDFTPIHRHAGGPVINPDGRFDKAVQVKTMQGPRSAIKTIEFVIGASLTFTLRILQAKGNKPSVAEDDLHTLFQYGGVHGYGGERGDGEGQYTYTIQALNGGQA